MAMRCDEIREQLVELLYNERGTSPANAELQAHVDSCPSCRLELAELQAARNWLQVWKDEPPLRSLAFPAPPARVVPMRPRSPALRWAQYAAVAALLLLGFLALANAEITWNKEGFAFRTRILPVPSSRFDPSSYYTKAEVRNIIGRVADETEGRMMDANQLMIEDALEILEQEHRNLRLVNGNAARLRGKN